MPVILSTPFSGFYDMVKLDTSAIMLTSFQLPFRDSDQNNSGGGGGGGAFNSLFGIPHHVLGPKPRNDAFNSLFGIHQTSDYLLVIRDYAFQLPFRDSEGPPPQDGGGRSRLSTPFSGFPDELKEAEIIIFFQLPFRDSLTS